MSLKISSILHQLYVQRKKYAVLLQCLLFFLLIVHFLYVFSGVLHYPLHSMDVFTIWLFKAKTLFLYKNDFISILSDSKYADNHAQYPLLLPFLFSIIYTLVGNVDEFWVLIFYPFLYGTILFVAYKLFRKLKVSCTWSLFFIYIYSMFSPLLAQSGRHHAGTADIVLVFLYWILLYTVFSYYKNKNIFSIVLLTIFIMIASNIKLEGVFLISTIFFLPLSKEKKLIFSFLGTLPFLIWMFFVHILHLPQDFGFIIPTLKQCVYRPFIIFLSVGKEMLHIHNWYIFWPLFWIVFIFTRFKTKITSTSNYVENNFTQFLVFSLITINTLFFFVYFTSSLPTYNYISSSIDRVIFQLSPFWFSLFVLWTKKWLYNIKIPAK